MIGTPVAFCLGAASLATVLYLGLPPVIVFQRLNSGVSVYALMAIPFRSYTQPFIVLLVVPFGIVGVGGDAQPGHRLIGLARAKQAARDLGGLAETDRQQAGRERIEAAGMAALLRTEQPPGRLQGGVRAHALRLVQQQQAIEATEVGASCHAVSRVRR